MSVNIATAINSAEAKDKPPGIKDDGKPSNGDQLNPPELDASGKPKRRAVSDSKQAWQIIKKLKEAAKRTRIPRNAEINKRYNGATPFPMQALVLSAQTWRNNFSTLFLASIIDRIRPVFQDHIQRSKFLTLASLPARFPDAARKSRVFREKITRTIRSWESWDDLLSIITQEDVLIGYATPARLDDDWRVRMFRSDEIFFPDGTGQDASRVAMFAVEQELLVHEFLDLIANERAAKIAGYMVENCVEIINEQFGEPANDAEKSAIELTDKAREGVSSSYGDEMKTISFGHLVIREYDGGIDLWTVDMKKGRLVRYKKGLHKEMTEATTLFTLQTGNTKLYGSKGAGRSLVNIATAIERARCLGADQMYLSGLLVVQCDEADFNTVQPVVRHPFIVLPKGVTVVASSIQYDAVAAAAQESKLVEIAETVVGSFIPSQVSQDATTPSSRIKDAQKVAREESIKQGVLSRFFRQFAKLIEGKQRKICSPRNIREALRVQKSRKAKLDKGVIVIAKKVMDWLEGVVNPDARQKNIEAAYESKIADRDAVEAIVEMLDEGLSPEEIAYLALAPAVETLDRESAENDNATSAWLQIAAQTPFVDKKEALLLGAEIAGVSEDRVNRVMLPETNDPAVEAEQAREQSQEWLALLAGEAQPVSPRDNHGIHRRVLYGKLQPLIQSIEASLQSTPEAPGASTTPELIGTARLGIGHVREHLINDRESNPDELKKEDGALKQWEKIIEQAEKGLAKAAELAAKAGAPISGTPVPVNGQPISVQGGEIPGDPNADADLIERGAELQLRAKEADQEDQRIELEKRDLEHREAIDLADRQLEAARVAMEAAKQSSTPSSTAPGA